MMFTSTQIAHVLIWIPPLDSSFENFIAAGELFSILLSGICMSLQLSYAVIFSTYTDVEDPGHVSFCYLKGLNPLATLPGGKSSLTCNSGFYSVVL